jgi:hypothetical protein
MNLFIMEPQLILAAFFFICFNINFAHESNELVMRFIRILVLLTLILNIFSSCNDNDNDNNESGGFYLQYAPFRIVIPEYMRYSDEYFNNYNHETDGDKIVRDLIRYIGIANLFAYYAEREAYVLYQFEEGIDTSFINSDTILTEYKKNMMFENNLYEYFVSCSRLGEQSNEPNGVFHQHYYNMDPSEGTIIHYSINRYYDDYQDYDSIQLIKVRLDYNHANTSFYDKEMKVSVENLTVSHQFPMDKFMVFAGLKDYYLDLYGNFNLPNSKFMTDEIGFNWSFVASGDLYNKIGVFEIGLPTCSFNSSSRTEILNDHSAYMVLARQLFQLMPNINNNYNAVLHYIKHIVPPYYVNRDGFVNSDTLPSSDYSTIKERLSTLVPFNPSTIENLEVTFGE